MSCVIKIQQKKQVWYQHSSCLTKNMDKSHRVCQNVGGTTRTRMFGTKWAFFQQLLEIWSFKERCLQTGLSCVDPPNLSAPGNSWWRLRSLHVHLMVHTNIHYDLWRTLTVKSKRVKVNRQACVDEKATPYIFESAVSILLNFLPTIGKYVVNHQ